MNEYILATRPWSFTAAIVPVLVTAGVTGASFTSSGFIRAMVMGVAVQAGANLTNTYFDYLNGVDTKDAGEKTLVENKLSPTNLLIFSITCYIIGAAVVLPVALASQSQAIIIVFAVGLVLAFFYTANPVGLKYRGLGDLTIFLCFGPLLMQGSSLLMIGELHHTLNYYTVPVGLLTEAILHANNARDIESDRRAGAVTVANIIGIKHSLWFFQFLTYGAYVSCVLLAALFHYGCLLPLLTLPLAFDLNKKFKDGKLLDLSEETAKTHLPFGVLLLLGILFTPSGFLSFFTVTI